MANTITAFLETLVAAAGEYNQAKVGTTELLDCVYMDVRPEAARAGKTIDVYFPDLGPMQSIGNNDFSPDSINPNYIPLSFNTRVGKALKVTDFEQWQTATDIMTKFIDPLHKRTVEYLNGQIANLITPANFNANAPIVGTTQGEITVTDTLAAWDALADQKVPLADRGNLNLLTHNNVYRKMMSDTNWIQENMVGATIAAAARQSADLGRIFNFTPRYDQQMPSASGTVIYGQIQVTNGSATVTGLNSAFTTDLTTSNKIVFGNDPTKTPYAISAIASDTSLTLGSTYSGATATTSARRQTVLAGTVTATTGSATVTGSGTAFTTALTVGDWIVFSGDTTKTPYQVLSIASNTSLTLTTNVVAAANGSGQSVTVISYTSIAMHKYAIALALRPIATPPEASRYARVAYINLKGIPLRVIVSWQHPSTALFLTADFGYAIGVIRPDFGVIIKS